MLVKIHKATRYVVAICDTELINKKYLDSDGLKQIDLTTKFFQGEEKTEEEVAEIIVDYAREDASFNIVGENACKIALKVGLVDKNGITKVANIPVALTLL
jgi:hypothetical protein